MTPAQALAVMQAIRPLLGREVVSVEGLPSDLGQLVLATPSGFLSVAVPLPHPLPLTLEETFAVVADAESRIRTVLTPYEGECGRGFGGSRGTLKPGEPGSSAADGWV